MNNRLILMLIVVTVLVAGAAVFSLRSNEEQQAASTLATGGVLFEDLAARVNEVSLVEVSSAEGTFALEKTDAGWGMRSKGGYPVDFDKVKTLVVGLAQLRVLEEKTSNPEYYGKLGVEDVAPGAASKRVTASDAAGVVLADVLVGNARASRGGGAGAGSLYVREQGAAQSLEVAGSVQVDAVPSGWLDKQIVKLDRQRVRQVEIRHPDGEVLVVEKQDLADEHFAVRDFPEGREPMWEGVADSIGGALGWINLEDVGPDLIDFDQAETTVATFTCFDGYVVTAETAQDGERTFLRVRGALDETQRADHVAVGPTPTPEAELEPPPEDADPTAETGLTAAEVQDEATALNAKVGEWIFEIPGYRAGDLRKRMNDLLKPLESEQPAEEAGSEPTLETGTSGLPPEVLEQLKAQGLMDAEGNLIAPGEPAAEEPVPVSEEPRQER